jgi:hypothetical protein
MQNAKCKMQNAKGFRRRFCYVRILHFELCILNFKDSH